MTTRFYAFRIPGGGTLYSNAYGNCDFYCHTYCDANRNSDRNSDRHGNCDANGNSDGNSDCHGNCDANRNSDGNCHGRRGTAAATPTTSVTPTPSEAPCAATGSQPGCNSIVFTQLTDFAVYISGFVGSAPPRAFSRLTGSLRTSAGGGGSTIGFHFNASPVIPGQNTMDIPLALSRAPTAGAPSRVSTAPSPTSHPRLRLHPDQRPLQERIRHREPRPTPPPRP